VACWISWPWNTKSKYMVRCIPSFPRVSLFHASIMGPQFTSSSKGKGACSLINDGLNSHPILDLFSQSTSCTVSGRTAIYPSSLYGTSLLALISLSRFTCPLTHLLEHKTLCHLREPPSTSPNPCLIKGANLTLPFLPSPAPLLPRYSNPKTSALLIRLPSQTQ